MSDAAALARWVAAMRRGDYEEAWRETDRGQRIARSEGRSELLWNGTPLAGRRVLVRCLHGLGDTLQFSRFLPRLADTTAETFVKPQPPLLPLLCAQPHVGTICRDFPASVDSDKIEIEIMELAYAFRAEPRTLPIPSLTIPMSSTRIVPKTNSLKVAIFWSASGWGGGRHVPLSLFASLGGIDGCTFYSFQQGPHASEACNSPLAVRQLSARTTQILDLARALLRMDLVITVDTMAAHLAGSLRREAWLLLERTADWRWIEGRSDTPWYPEMRIFRESAGGWESAIASIHENLACLASRHAMTHPQRQPNPKPYHERSRR